jgi:hypothetical protein
MQLHITHVFAGVTAKDYERLYFDEVFNLALGNALHLGRTLVHLDRSAQRIVRHVCYAPHREAGHMIDHAYGTSRASFVEELDYDVNARRGRWRTIPNRFADRVNNAGTIEFTDVPGGVRRVVAGEVKVAAFGFGGIIERMIVREIEANYEKTTKFTREWLAAKR